jgi:hypothetical protein
MTAGARVDLQKNPFLQISVYLKSGQILARTSERVIALILTWEVGFVKNNPSFILWVCGAARAGYGRGRVDRAVLMNWLY